MEILLFAGLMILLLWFMSSRTRKQQQRATAFRDNLAEGQEVMTGSGLFGTVVDVEGDVVTLEMSPGVTSRWLKAAIAKLVDPPVEDDGEEYDDDDEYDDDEYDDEDWEDAPEDHTASTQTPDEDNPRS